MLDGDEEPVRIGVLEQHVFVLGARVIGHRAHLDEPPDAVIAVHHEVARGILEHERLARRPAGRRTARAAGRRRLSATCTTGERRAAPFDRAEELGVRVDVEPESRCCESLGKLGCADNRRAVRHGCRRRGEISSIGGAESLVAGELLDAMLLAGDHQGRSPGISH